MQTCYIMFTSDKRRPVREDLKSFGSVASTRTSFQGTASCDTCGTYLRSIRSTDRKSNFPREFQGWVHFSCVYRHRSSEHGNAYYYIIHRGYCFDREPLLRTAQRSIM